MVVGKVWEGVRWVEEFELSDGGGLGIDDKAVA